MDVASQITKEALIDWINQQDFFYVKDVFCHFGLKRIEPASLGEQLISKTLSDLRKCNYIQSGGRGGDNNSSIQYFLISTIPSDYILIDRIKKELVKSSFLDSDRNIKLILSVCDKSATSPSIFLMIKLKKEYLDR